MSFRGKKLGVIPLAAALGLTVLVVLAVAAALDSDPTGSGDPGAGNPESELTAAQATAPIRGAPPELAALREQANQIIEIDADGFEQVLADLRGTPVVINKWASWCGPCRFEFPFFQSQAVERERDVAFIGLDSNDTTDAAETFLSELPLPYPSYSDPDLELAESFDAGREFPATIFIGADGDVAHLKLGGYASEADLAADIDRYAQ